MSAEIDARGLAALAISISILRGLKDKGLLSKEDVDGLLNGANNDIKNWEAQHNSPTGGYASGLIAGIRAANNGGNL